MEIIIRGMNMTVNERTYEYAEKKLTKLDRYLPDIAEARMELGQEKQRHREQPVAQLTVRTTRGVILRAEEKKEGDLNAAIDQVIDKMYRRIQSYKGKRKQKGGEKWYELEPEWASMEEVPLASEAVIEDAEEAKTQILRRKTVQLNPMSEEEAIDQMELLGHDFFMFFNADTAAINVAYKREDGNYGILTPQMG